MASIDNYYKPTPSDPNNNPLEHAGTATLKPTATHTTEYHESKMGDPCQSTF
jgi:hypothetical protein